MTSPVRKNALPTNGNPPPSFSTKPHPTLTLSDNILVIDARTDAYVAGFDLNEVELYSMKTYFDGESPEDKENTSGDYPGVFQMLYFDSTTQQDALANAKISTAYQASGKGNDVVRNTNVIIVRGYTISNPKKPLPSTRIRYDVIYEKIGDSWKKTVYHALSEMTLERRSTKKEIVS